MATPKGRVFTGARARLSIEGKVIGYATDCTGGERITYEPLKVLDRITTVEHVATDYDVTFSATYVKIMGETLRSLDIFPKHGVDDAEFLRNILDMGEMSATIEDSRTGQFFMMLEQVKTAARNWRVTARGIVSEDVEFVAIRMKTEEEIPA